MVKVIIDADAGGPTISKHVYGHFAEHLGRCIYGGFWVGEDSPVPNVRGVRKDVVDALRAISIPNLRWPGGCFADIYHWRDGVGPRSLRPEMVNVVWGGVTENNHFGTHEYFDLCDLLGAEPYICGNVGSGTVREMAEWLEYVTMPGRSPMADLRRSNGRDDPWDIEYWAVGNENWGCGGNMTPLQYSYEFRRYQTYCKHFGGKRLHKVACGQFDDWNEVVMREAGKLMDSLSVHYYCFAGGWERKGSAAGFPRAEWYSSLKSALGLDDFLKKTEAIMDRHDPERRVGLIVDEWGAWWDAEPGTNPAFLYQQNTIRDAVIAALSFHVFHRHADRVRMANIAQTVNVLQSMILTEGPEMVLTPTYHVFEMFKGHQGAASLPSRVEGPKLERDGTILPGVSASATKGPDGRMLLTLCNLDTEAAAEIRVEMRGLAKNPRVAESRVLAGAAMDDRNTFDSPGKIVPRPLAAKMEGGALSLALPPMSVAAISLDA